MKIERTDKEVVFTVSGDAKLDDLQDLADLLEFKELSKQSKATQSEVDSLVASIKKGRWEKTKEKIGL